LDIHGPIEPFWSKSEIPSLQIQKGTHQNIEKELNHLKPMKKKTIEAFLL